MEMLDKSPQNYNGAHNNISVYDQKPIKNDDFNEAEEKKIKDHVGKRKIKRWDVTENNKIKKKETRRR